MTRRLAGAILVLAIALTAMAARSGPASARASGMVTAEYSGTQDFTFVYDPKNPDTWQQHGTRRSRCAQPAAWPCSSASPSSQ